MTTKEQILQTWQGVKNLFTALKGQYPNWYASLRIPAGELERRIKEFIKEIPDE